MQNDDPSIAALALAHKLAKAVTESVGVRFHFDKDDVGLITANLLAARREGEARATIQLTKEAVSRIRGEARRAVLEELVTLIAKHYPDLWIDFAALQKQARGEVGDDTSIS